MIRLFCYAPVARSKPSQYDKPLSGTGSVRSSSPQPMTTSKRSIVDANKTETSHNHIVYILYVYIFIYIYIIWALVEMSSKQVLVPSCGRWEVSLALHRFQLLSEEVEPLLSELCAFSSNA